MVAGSDRLPADRFLGFPGSIVSDGSPRAISRVLIANRGEIAVRIVRACHDAGLVAVAVYAEPDRNALHVRLADEAYALGGSTPAESYLDAAKVLAAAVRSDADAVHPGYGFLSENAGFAESVIAAGLTWIGPPPAAIRLLGDKVAARKIAVQTGTPLVPGTPGPVSGAAEIADFASEYGLPVAIKASFGGGGRGLKVARTMAEIPGLYESAVREAVAAFGRGECFAERYLERPRHIETQCLADQFGTVAVVSTRDCSLQRRHQKLVEEAPAPFLTAAQESEICQASVRILQRAAYVGAGTCEFLLGADGTISFLEVNTRLQVEHPVTEEVTGIDLVREQLRIAVGERLGYERPEARGHAMEFRINSEDPGRGFLPVPGTITTWKPPLGPGVRVDSGVEAGSVVGPAWDSLLAKLIVTGADRDQVLRRARRALAEFQISGLATLLPFHRKVVSDPAFAERPDGTFAVHTRWIETEFANDLPGYEDEDGPGYGDEAGEASGQPGAEQEERATVVAEVDGRRVEVSLPAAWAKPASSPRSARASQPRKAGSAASTGAARSAPVNAALVAPMAGVIVKVAVTDGQAITEGDLVVMLEAMKMEQPVRAHRSGTVRGAATGVGEPVAAGTLICIIE
jgi:acetyl-CoA/propionyl-CoA carboxylase biotin carboxyl carrier protein